MKENKMKMAIISVLMILLIGLIAWLCYGYVKNKKFETKNPIVTMEVKDYGTVKIELYPDKAPNTVKNFVKLTQNGYYDGLKFHRIIKDFMIQGGDYKGNGTGGGLVKYLENKKADIKEEAKSESEDSESADTQATDKEYCIEGEFIENGFSQNDLNLTEGTIAMARSDYTQYSPSLAKQSYNSGATQFFIMTSDNYTALSGKYTGFGKVIEGMDVVKKIAAVEVKAASSGEENSEETEANTENAEVSTPVKDVIISSATVDTFGVDYGMPETVEPFNYMQWLYSMYGLQM